MSTPRTPELEAASSELDSALELLAGARDRFVAAGGNIMDVVPKILASFGA